MASRNISVSEASRPVLPRHARLKFDETRKVWVILAPERVLAPDEIAVEVLQLCDGQRSVGVPRALAHDGGDLLQQIRSHRVDNVNATAGCSCHAWRQSNEKIPRRFARSE